MVIAVSYGEASVEILFMLWVGGLNLGWCTFLFDHDQARALRLFSLVKPQVLKNQRVPNSVQTGFGLCIFKGGADLYITVPKTWSWQFWMR